MGALWDRNGKGKWKYKRARTFTWPDDFQLAHVPRNVAVREPFGSFQRAYQFDERSLTLTETISIEAGRVEAEAYGAFRRFCTAVARARSERVVLKKRRTEKQQKKSGPVAAESAK